MDIEWTQKKQRILEYGQRATNTLKEYIKKGFVLNDELLKNRPKFGKDYFKEWLERIRSIRTSERRIWQHITDIFAECSIGVYIFLDDNSNLEIKISVTKVEYRNKGYAKSLLKFLCGNYKQKNNKILVGVTEKDIPFFVKLGFDKYEKTISDYCYDKKYKDVKNPSYTYKNLIYYSKDLKK